MTKTTYYGIERSLLDCVCKRLTRTKLAVLRELDRGNRLLEEWHWRRGAYRLSFRFAEPHVWDGIGPTGRVNIRAIRALRADALIGQAYKLDKASGQFYLRLTKLGRTALRWYARA